MGEAPSRPGSQQGRTIYGGFDLKTFLVLRPIWAHSATVSGKVFFFAKSDVFNKRRLIRVKKCILVIIGRVIMPFLGTIGQSLKIPSPFVSTPFLNVTNVIWLYYSPMKKPRDMKFCVKLD